MAEPIHEVLPGVLHWTARHPTARLESGSHYLVDEGILIDPIAPPDGVDWFDDREIGEILLTNRHHTRSAFELQERLSATIRAPRTGMHDLPVDRVQPYDFGDGMSAGIRPHAISETWPDETALEIPGHRAVAIADGVTNYDGLGFFATPCSATTPRPRRSASVTASRGSPRRSTSTICYSPTGHRSSATAASSSGASPPAVNARSG
jgi:hypothetical protein